jgi:hypothetical protein
MKNGNNVFKRILDYSFSYILELGILNLIAKGIEISLHQNSTSMIWTL